MTIIFVLGVVIDVYDKLCKENIYVKNKKILSVSLLIVAFLVPTAVFAYEPAIGGTPIDPEEGEDILISNRSNQGKQYTIPGGQGVLTANVWRSTIGEKRGNTIQWDYQVSAVYSGHKRLKSIRTSWYASDTLRNSASMDLGFSNSGVTAGAGGSWTRVSTPVKYYENTRGQKIVDRGSNVVITPSKDYRSRTISVVNTAMVTLDGDAKSYDITSGI